MAQWQRFCLQCRGHRRCRFDPWVRKIHWRRAWQPIPVFLSFPGGLGGKESTCSVGDLGSIPGLGRSAGEGNGYPLQYSCLEKFHGVAKSDTTEQPTLLLFFKKNKKVCPISAFSPFPDLRGKDRSGFGIYNTLSYLFQSIYPWAHTYVKVKVLLAQSCLTLCVPMDCSPPGSSVHGILQARILEWVAFPFSRGSS